MIHKTSILPAAEALAGIFGMGSPDAHIILTGHLDLVGMDTDQISLPIISELLGNNLEKGATQVRITVGPNQVIVEDNYQNNVPDELAAILANLSADRVISTKKFYKNGEPRYSGVGVMSTRIDLEEMGGQLTYQVTGDNRIIAIATWPNKVEPASPYEYGATFVVFPEDLSLEKEAVEWTTKGWELIGDPIFKMPHPMYFEFDASLKSGFVLLFRRPLTGNHT